MKNDGYGMWNIRVREELHSEFWWRKLKENVHLEGLGINCRVLLKWIFKNRMWPWNWLIWFKIETSGGVL